MKPTLLNRKNKIKNLVTYLKFRTTFIMNI